MSKYRPEISPTRREFLADALAKAHVEVIIAHEE
jgi:hypothetical protein